MNEILRPPIRARIVGGLAAMVFGMGSIAVLQENLLGQSNEAIRLSVGLPAAPPFTLPELTTSSTIVISKTTTTLFHKKPPALSANETQLLACIKSYETLGEKEPYKADTGNGYFGAYQFNQPTWNDVAKRVGRKDLIGVNPSRALPEDQDYLANELYKWRNLDPWPTPKKHC